MAAFEDVEELYNRELLPAEQYVSRFSPESSKEIVLHSFRYANENDIPFSLFLSILFVESRFQPRARSFVGATGVAQVMPLHRGKWGCGNDLWDLQTNICSGARILGSYYRDQRGDWNKALLRYNGCVRGTNTPNCHQYPNWIFMRAGVIAAEIEG